MDYKNKCDSFLFPFWQMISSKYQVTRTLWTFSIYQLYFYISSAYISSDLNKVHISEGLQRTPSIRDGSRWQNMTVERSCAAYMRWCECFCYCQLIHHFALCTYIVMWNNPRGVGTFGVCLKVIASQACARANRQLRNKCWVSCLHRSVLCNDPLLGKHRLMLEDYLL